MRHCLDLSQANFLHKAVLKQLISMLHPAFGLTTSHHLQSQTQFLHRPADLRRDPAFAAIYAVLVDIY